MLLPLLGLALSEQRNVLVLQLIIHGLLIASLSFTVLFVTDLLVEFLANEAATFLLAHERLLLLLVVQKLVELLDGSPLVLLGDLRVDFGAAGHARGTGELIRGETTDGAIAAATAD